MREAEADRLASSSRRYWGAQSPPTSVCRRHLGLCRIDAIGRRRRGVGGASLSQNGQRFASSLVADVTGPCRRLASRHRDTPHPSAPLLSSVWLFVREDGGQLPADPPPPSVVRASGRSNTLDALGDPRAASAVSISVGIPKINFKGRQFAEIARSAPHFPVAPRASPEQVPLG